MSGKRAVIFGVTGQDGSYLAELLLEKGYRVVGVARRVSGSLPWRLGSLLGRQDFCLAAGDVTDAMNVHRLLQEHNPHEVYNLAAQSHVGASFVEPSHTWAVTAGGALNILEACRWLCERGSEVRLYQASSSEMFGSSFSRLVEHSVGAVVEHSEPPDKPDGPWCYQDEQTPMLPNSPYAIAKLAAHQSVRLYRDAYGLFACSGILFNHESPRRGEEFVTRKIARYVARLKVALASGESGPGRLGPLRLGNMGASRDWGWAPDYVRAMWLMLRQERPTDFVVATGQTHTVREFLECSWRAAELPAGLMDEVVCVSPELFRPSEVPYLRGEATNARRQLGWAPEVTFDELVGRMVLSEIAAANRAAAN